jgi:hypothetical protein
VALALFGFGAFDPVHGFKATQKLWIASAAILRDRGKSGVRFAVTLLFEEPVDF